MAFAAGCIAATSLSSARRLKEDGYGRRRCVTAASSWGNANFHASICSTSLFPLVFLLPSTYPPASLDIPMSQPLITIFGGRLYRLRRLLREHRTVQLFSSTCGDRFGSLNFPLGAFPRTVSTYKRRDMSNLPVQGGEVREQSFSRGTAREGGFTGDNRGFAFFSAAERLSLDVGGQGRAVA